MTWANLVDMATAVFLGCVADKGRGGFITSGIMKSAEGFVLLA